MKYKHKNCVKANHVIQVIINLNDKSLRLNYSSNSQYCKYDYKAIVVKINNSKSPRKNKNDDIKCLKCGEFTLKPIMSRIQLGLPHMYVLHHLAPHLGNGRIAFLHSSIKGDMVTIEDQSKELNEVVSYTVSVDNPRSVGMCGTLQRWPGWNLRLPIDLSLIWSLVFGFMWILNHIY